MLSILMSYLILLPAAALCYLPMRDLLKSRRTVSFVFTAKQGSPVSLSAEDSHGSSFTVYGEIPQTAQNKGLTAEQVQKISTLLRSARS